MKRAIALLGIVLLLGLATAANYDSLNCRLIGHCALPNSLGGDVDGNVACLAATDSGLYVIDVSDPTNPVEVGHLFTPSYATTVDVVGHYAYMADNYGLRVIDISDPAHPTQVSSYRTASGAVGVTVVGNHAYVAAWTSGLYVMDVTDPAHPVKVGHCDTDSARVVTIAGNYAYVADQGETRIIDISDPTNPFNVGSFPSTYYAEGVDVVGHYMYIADGTTIRIVDISDPANPTEAAYYDQLGYAYYIDIVADYAYVANDRRGLRVLDVSDPVHPHEVGYYDTPGYSVTVTKVVGGYAYVTDYDGPDGGLSIIEFYGEEVGVEENRRPPAYGPRLTASIVRGNLCLTEDRGRKTEDRVALLDAAGRKVMELQPGPNDVQHLGPGVYFVSSPGSVAKVVLTR
jgi:hypothetical protein